MHLLTPHCNNRGLGRLKLNSSLKGPVSQVSDEIKAIFVKVTTLQLQDIHPTPQSSTNSLIECKNNSSLLHTP